MSEPKIICLLYLVDLYLEPFTLGMISSLGVPYRLTSSLLWVPVVNLTLGSRGSLVAAPWSPTASLVMVTWFTS